MMLHKYSRSGFTLIELIVAIGLFSILVSIAIGGFVQALRSERQAAALLAANSNVSLIIEEMAREMRTSGSFSSPSPQEIDFIDEHGNAVAYCYDAALQAIRRRAGSGACLANGDRITSSNVAVRELDFAVAGGAPGSFPVRVVINLGVSGKGDPALASIVTNIQTVVSARNLN